MFYAKSVVVFLLMCIFDLKTHKGVIPWSRISIKL